MQYSNIYLSLFSCLAGHALAAAKCGIPDPLKSYGTSSASSGIISVRCNTYTGTVIYTKSLTNMQTATTTVTQVLNTGTVIIATYTPTYYDPPPYFMIPSPKPTTTTAPVVKKRDSTTLPLGDAVSALDRTVWQSFCTCVNIHPTKTVRMTPTVYTTVTATTTVTETTTGYGIASASVAAAETVTVQLGKEADYNCDWTLGGIVTDQDQQKGPSITGYAQAQSCGASCGRCWKTYYGGFCSTYSVTVSGSCTGPNLDQCPDGQVCLLGRQNVCTPLDLGIRARPPFDMICPMKNSVLLKAGLKRRGRRGSMVA